jgi:hypothetical protein
MIPFAIFQHPEAKRSGMDAVAKPSRIGPKH